MYGNSDTKKRVCCLSLHNTCHRVSYRRILWKEIKSSVKCMGLLRLSWHFKTIWMSCLRHSRDTKEQTRLLWVLVSSKHSRSLVHFTVSIKRLVPLHCAVWCLQCESICYIRFVCEIKRHVGYRGTQKPQIMPFKNTCSPPECNFPFVAWFFVVEMENHRSIVMNRDGGNEQVPWAQWYEYIMWGMLQQMGVTSTATGDDTPLSA